MTPPLPPLFTLAQLAAALGLSVPGAQKRLRGVPPCGRALVRGQQALAWTVAALPETMRDELEERARRGQYRDAAHLLTDPARGWRPCIDGQPVTLGQVAERDVAEATKLQRALLPSLQRLTADPPVPAAEAAARGLAEYRAEFGHVISDAHWRRLVNRTIERAGCRGDYPLEIFLPARLTRRAATGGPPGVAAASGLHDLCRTISYVKQPSAPTPHEAALVWDTAFAELAALAATGDARKARREVFCALKDSGLRLAKSTAALEMAFSRKLARWQAAGCKPSSLVDGRTLPRPEARLELPEEDRLTLVARAVERGGRISQAWREVRHTGELSPEITARYIANPASKSYMPRAVRDAVKHDVAIAEDIHHGPRQAKLNGAWIPRDYSDVRPGDWQQGDDCTLPIYYWEQTPEGTRAFRGQFIVLVDVKTSYVLGYALHSQEQYNARIIRSLIVQVHDSYGLPKEGFYFEGNIWKRSRILKGRAADAIALEETEQGLREFVRFRHAGLPRAKIIEGVLGILQNEVEPLAGYCGRNEKTDKYERLQKKLLEAASGKITYASFLMHKEQWIERLDAVCERFNSEAQGGRLKGLSPREAYEQGFDYDRGALRLPGNCRYLLANHRRVEKVSKNGVRIVAGGNPYYYRSADTGRMVGQRVLVWHDVEEAPQSITITDLKRQNAVEVPRVDPVPSMTATREQLGAAMRQAAAHGAYARTLYRIIQPRFQRNLFRPVLVDAATRELGAKIDAGRAEIGAKDARRRMVERRIDAAEREAGVRFGKPHRNAERKLDGLEMLRRADELERQEGGNQ